MKARILTSWLDLLLVFVPVTVILAFVQPHHLAVFISAALAIIPLAGLLGRATEHLTTYVGAGVGGLLNASLGNAAELIIALVALREGLHDVVKASLTGSIIGNILLVLGASMLAGGLKYERQKFNRNGIESAPAFGRRPHHSRIVSLDRFRPWFGRRTGAQS
jgi:Ca2+:H+ antiporter